MRAKDLVLYQIATDRHYKVGDKLEFGKECGFQGQRVLNGAKLEKKRTYDEGYLFVNSKKIFANKKLVLKLSKLLEEYDFTLRELAFEEVRKTEFQDYPSRLKCMYLIDNKQTCLKNLELFHQKGHGTFFQAVAVKLNGKIFCATSQNVTRSGLSFEEYKTKAREYWSQDQNSTLPKNEILFEGKAEIIEVIKEFKYDGKK